MSSEDFVSFNIMKYLKNNNWHILQYHPPGGQACFALKVLGEIVYPDIVAYKDGLIFLLENKGKFTKSDIIKLRKMISDNHCKEQLKIFIKNYLHNTNLELPSNFLYIWGHGYSGKLNLNTYEDIYLLHVSDSGNISISRDKSAYFE